MRGLGALGMGSYLGSAKCNGVTGPTAVPRSTAETELTNTKGVISYFALVTLDFSKDNMTHNRTD